MRTQLIDILAQIGPIADGGISRMEVLLLVLGGLLTLALVGFFVFIVIRANNEDNRDTSTDDSNQRQ